MTLGQRVAVMRDGRIQQVDTPQRLYASPVNLFVAAFIGSPSMNLVEATIDGEAVRFAGFALPLDASRRPQGGPDRVILGIRPESFEDGALADPALPRVEVGVTVLEELGSDAHVIFTLDAPRVEAEALRAAHDDEEAGLIADDRAVWNARVDSKTTARAGSAVRLSIDPSELYFFDPASGESLVDGRVAVAV